MSTTSLRHLNDTVHCSISTRRCGCASLEHSWQHHGDVSEWFMQKTETLLKFGAHSGQLRHSLSGSVTLKAQQKSRQCSWEPFDDLPYVYKQHLHAFESDSTFLLQRSVTHQDDVQSDVRRQLIQAVKHPYSFFQSLLSQMSFHHSVQLSRREIVFQV